ncbi:hypothetical protein NL676_023777 [Syzygium grande]|nr:hypothetical protein NL676_023777 [Syzygium grande]
MDLPANVSIHLGLNFIKVEQNRGRSPDQGSEVNRHRRRSMKEAPIFTSDERRHRDEGSFDMHQLVTTARSQRRTLSVAEAATQSSSGRHGQAQGVGGQRPANHCRLAVGREQLAIQERRASGLSRLLLSFSDLPSSFSWDENKDSRGCAKTEKNGSLERIVHGSFNNNFTGFEISSLLSISIGPLTMMSYKKSSKWAQTETCILGNASITLKDFLPAKSTKCDILDKTLKSILPSLIA